MILRKQDPDLVEQEYIDNVPQANQAFIQHLLANQVGNSSTFPVPTPVEINPYNGIVPLQNYDKYMIGTCPPISYILDEEAIINAGITHIQRPNGGDDEVRPKIPYFHGNRFEMWKLFFDEEFFVFDANDNAIRYQRRQEILNFLSGAQVNYSDIIYSTKREMYDAEDKHLKNVVIHKGLIKHILHNPQVNRLLFNTSPTFGNQGICIHQNQVQNGVVGRINVNNGKCNAFGLFFRTCQDLGFKVEFQVGNERDEIWTEVNVQNAEFLRGTFKNKIIFRARITVKENNILLSNTAKIVKEFFVVTPFSPSRAARNLNNTVIVGNWLAQNPGQNRQELLASIYNSFLTFNENDRTFLYNLNHNVV